METIFKHSRYCLVILFMLFAVSAKSQMLTAIDPGPPVKISNADRIEHHEQSQQDNSSNQQLPQRDEYGQFNFNAYLTGLGSTGGYMAAGGVLNENANGSVEAWVYPTATTSSAPAIVAKGDATNVGFYFGIAFSSGSKLFMRFGNSASINSSGTTIPLNQWTHVACTWTGGSGNYTVRFYVNGSLSGSSSSNSGSWNVGSDSLTVGDSKASFSGTNFYGYIDEVKYWTDLRSTTEIRVNRFVGLGDGTGANSGNALTSSSHYTGLNDSWNFNVGGTTIPDYINNHNGHLSHGASTVYSSYAPTPMPYNYALRLTGSTNTYLVIPDNGAFDQTADGSIEAWVYMTTASHLNTIFHKGTSFSTGTLAFYVTASNRVGINIGPHNYISNGQTLAANRWYHLAATWTGGPNFTVRLYVNGDLDYTSTYNGAMPTNSNPAWIGRYYTTTGNFIGYIDEVRFWANRLTQDRIRANMFASGRTLLPNSNLIGIWNFDGNLLNRGTTSGINASFNSGGTNNGYISAFRNENNSGALSTSFQAHATVVNRLLSVGPFPFPSGFAIRIPNKPITDNSSTFDTINIPGTGTLSSINVFFAVRHTWCADLDVTLKAPNGQTRNLTSDNGGSGDDALTFFVDGAPSVTTSSFYPPWSRIAGPEATMGSFNSTTIHGNWILEVHDDAGGDTGNLIGWGIRFNNGVTNSDPVSTNVPGVYKLYQNYPNPFNPTTNIKFDLPKSSLVKIIIYDILGREVKTVVNEFKNAGSYELNFDASNFASGTYLYRIEAGDFVNVKKMVLIK